MDQPKCVVKLDCGHEVLLTGIPRVQYEGDENYVRCPKCTLIKLRNPNKVATAWNLIVEVNDDLSHVHGGLPLIMLDDVLRLQPKGPRSRYLPFPYRKGPRQ